jgi:hypothetical protein
MVSAVRGRDRWVRFDEHKWVNSGERQRINPITFPDECGYVLKHFREPLTHGPVNPPDSQQDAIRQRAFDLILRLLRATQDGLNRIEEAYPKFNDLPEAEQTSDQSFIQIIDCIGTEIYFASGAYNAKRQSRTDDSGLLTDKEKAHFYDEAGPILDALAEVALPSLRRPKAVFSSQFS